MDNEIRFKVTPVKLPHSIRQMLLSQATSALHELLKDESIDHVTFDMIEAAQSKLLSAYEKLETWEKVIS